MGMLCAEGNANNKFTDARKEEGKLSVKHAEVRQAEKELADAHALHQSKLRELADAQMVVEQKTRVIVELRVCPPFSHSEQISPSSAPVKHVHLSSGCRRRACLYVQLLLRRCISICSPCWVLSVASKLQLAKWWV